MNVFQEKIDSLVDCFKGRTEEIRDLKRFCKKGTGTFIVFGSPGIGKSALLAKLLKEIEGNKSIVKSSSDNVKASYPPIIGYFINRNTKYSSNFEFLSLINIEIDKIYKFKNITVGNNLDERYKKLQERLSAIAKKGNDQKLILCIDGMDESFQIRRYLPSPEFNKCLKLIIFSRPDNEIVDWSRTWNREQIKTITLDRLSSKLTKELIYEVVDTGQININKLIQNIIERSKGNPLFIKFYCNIIRDNKGKIDPNEVVPEGIDNLIHDIVKRITNKGNDRNASNLLHLLTEAKCFLSYSTIAEFLKINIIRAQSAVDKCGEILIMEKNSSGQFIFQLFHDYVRDWFNKYHKNECKKTAYKLSKHCINYHQKTGDTREYVLKYAVDHIVNIEDHELLWQQLSDEEYRVLQIKTFNQYHFSYEALKKGLEFYIQRNGKEKNDDPRLCWLALRAEELAAEASKNVEVVLGWVRKCPIEDHNRMNDALDSLEVLNEKNFYKVSLLLLWTESDRQAELPNEKRFNYDAVKVINKVEERIPTGTELIDWRSFISDDFMAWICVHVLNSIPSINLFGYINRTSILEIFLDSIINNHLTKSNNKQTRKIFEFALEIAENLDENAKYRLINIIHAMAKIGEFTWSLDSIKKYEDLLDDKKDEALSCIILAMSDYGKFNLALENVDKILDVSLKSETLSNIAIAVAESGDSSFAQLIIKNALEVAESIGDINQKLEPIKKIALSLTKAGKHRKAMKIIENIENKVDKCEAIADIAKAIAESGDREFLREIFSHVKDIVDSIDDEDEKCFSLVIIAIAKAVSGERASACETLNFAMEIIVSHGDLIDQCETLSEIAEYMLETGKKDLINEILINALEIAENIEDKKEKMEIISNIAKIMAETGEYIRALNLVKEVENIFYKSEALSIIAVALAKEGNYSLVLKTVESIVPGTNQKEALSGIFQELVSDGDYTQALEIISIIKDEDDKSNAISDLAGKLAIIGEIEKAKIIYSKAIITSDNNNYDVYEALNIISYLAESDKSGFPQEILMNALNITKSIKDEYFKCLSMLDIASAMVKAGDRNTVNKILKSCLKSTKDHNKLCKCVLLIKIAEVMIQINKYNKVIEIFSEVLEITELIDEDLYECVVLKMLSKTTLETINAGNIKVVHHILLEVITSTNNFQGEQLKTEVLSNIVKLLTQVENINDESKILINELNTETVNELRKFSANSITVNAISLAGEFAQATEAAESISDEYEKCLARINIVINLFQAGKEKSALKMLSNCTIIAEKINDKYHKSKILSEIAIAMVKVGEIVIAREIAYKALSTAKNIEDSNKKYEVYSLEIIGAMVLIGELNLALELVHTINHTLYKQHALENIIKSITNKSHIIIIAQYMKQIILPYKSWEKIIPKWCEFLLENLHDNTSLLRESILFSPFDPVVKISIRSLLIAHIGKKDLSIYEAIIRHCPQLNLDFVIESKEEKEAKLLEKINIDTVAERLNLTSQQRVILSFLYEKHKDGTRLFTNIELEHEIYTGHGFRLKDKFLSRKEYYEKIFKFPSRGKFELNLDYLVEIST